MINSLPENQRAAFEADVGTLLQKYLDADDYHLSPEQEKIDLARFEESSPNYVSQDKINSIWGKDLPG